MRRKYLFVVLVLMLTLLIGCGKTKEASEENEDNRTVVFNLGDIAVTKGEVYIYANTIKEKYNDEYGEEVWQVLLKEGTDESATVEELTRKAIIEEIVRVKLYASHAEEYNVRLSESEEATVVDESHSFYQKLTEQDIRDMELSEELAYMVMKENMLEKKVKEAVLVKEPVEISDEQARMTCFYDMYFPCFSVNEAGYVKPYSDEEKEEQYKDAIEACSALATAEIGEDDAAQDIETLAEIYGLTESKEQTLSPDEIKEIYGEEIYNTIYEMKNGQYSTVVESEYGYHVFQMLELTAEEATAEKKREMTETAIRKLIEGKEESWKNEIDKDFSYPESVNMDIYNTIKISE